MMPESLLDVAKAFLGWDEFRDIDLLIHGISQT